MRGVGSRLRSIASARGVGVDIASIVVLQGLAALTSFAINPLLTRTLGNAGYDAYALCTQSLVNIGAAVADFGIAAVIMHRLSVTGGLTSTAFIPALKLRTVTFFLGFLVTIVGTLASGNSDLLLAASIGFGAVALSSKFTGIRQIPELVWRLKGRTWVVGAILLFDSILFILILRLLDSAGTLTLLTALAAFSLSSLPGFLLVTIPVLHMRRRFATDARPVPPRYYRTILVQALPIGVMALAGQLFARIEPIVIDTMIGRSYVGEYVAAVLPLAGTMFIPVNVALGLMPLISQAAAGRREDVSIGWIISLGTRILGALGLFFGTLCFLFAEEIMSIYGPEYVQYAYILRLYSITTLLEFMVVLFDQTLIATRARREVLIGTVLSFVLALGLQVAAVHPFGMLGILFAKMAAVAGKIIYQLVVVEKEARLGALQGLGRLTIPAGALALTFWATSSLDPLVRLLIVLPVGAGSLLLSRTVDVRELLRLRQLRLS